MQIDGTVVYLDTDGNWEEDYNDKIVTLMQFTGLHDINGQPIYEGDIVSITDNTGDTYFYNIQWKPDCYMMVGDGGPGEWLSMEEFEGCVIVGNKYENPELNPR